MDIGKKKYVKVRVNASGRRVIGIVGVPPPYFRISDFLNSHDEFFLVKQEKSDLYLAKDCVSYLEALEEGEDAGSRPRSGGFRPVTVTLRNHGGAFRGEVFVPESADVPTTLNKVRRFINFRAVQFTSSAESYSFIAVGKQEVILVQEDHDGR